MSKVIFVPRATVHEGTLNLNAHGFDVLLASPLEEVMEELRSGRVAAIRKEDCIPLLTAAKLDLIRSLGLSARLSSAATK